MKISKILFHISWLSSIYFLLLALNHYVIKSNFVLIGIAQEFITIPLMCIQLAICAIALFYCTKHSFNTKEYSTWTFLISLCNSIMVVATFLGYLK